MEFYEELINAIIKQAVIDYIKACIEYDEKMIKDCVKFFRSEYFHEMRNIDPIYIQREADECVNNISTAIAECRKRGWRYKTYYPKMVMSITPHKKHHILKFYEDPNEFIRKVEEYEQRRMSKHR